MQYLADNLSAYIVLNRWINVRRNIFKRLLRKVTYFSKDTTVDAKDLFVTFANYLYEYEHVGDVFIINVIETVCNIRPIVVFIRGLFQ